MQPRAHVAGFGAPPPPEPPPPIRWRALLDNAVLEAIASTFVNYAALAFANLGYAALDGGGGAFADPWAQLPPALATGLVMLTCKDEALFPPDAAPTITLLLWALGAYDSWMQAAARLLGHAAGVGVTLLLCSRAALPPQGLPGAPRAGSVVFGSEVIATIIEHFAIVYLCLPLLPANFSQHERFRARQRVASVAPAFAAPPNSAVLQMALAFAASHWCLRVTFASEMNPSVTAAKGLVAAWQGAPRWDECALALWGQAVGLLCAVVYAVAFAPKPPPAAAGH